MHKINGSYFLYPVTVGRLGPGICLIYFYFVFSYASVWYLERPAKRVRASGAINIISIMTGCTGASDFFRRMFHRLSLCGYTWFI